MKLIKVLGLVLVAVASADLAHAQDRQQARARIDVRAVALDAQINPTAQTLSATAKVTFIPLDNTSTVTFELNNALNLTRVTDLEGRQITASRFGEDMSVRLSLPQPLPKGQPATLTFVYQGKLTGQEESPVFGIKFAAITPRCCVSDVPGAVVPGQRLYGGPLRCGFPGDGTGRIPCSSERHRSGGCDCARGHAYRAFSIRAGVVPR